MTVATGRVFLSLAAGLVVASAAPARADVTFYVDANYRGRSMTLGEGRWDINQLSIGNDQLSSVRVPNGWHVVLYEHARFQGRTVELDGDVAFLNNFNDLTSSIVITRTRPEVTFYVDANYRGRSMSLGEGRWDLRQLSIGNDQLSSVRVPRGLHVTLYEHEHFQGRTFELDDDTRFLNNFNDLTSSIVITRGRPHQGPPTVDFHRGRKCADEGGWCDFKGPATVYYGERDKFVVQKHPGRVQCANSVFGDPLVGVRKACWVDGEQPAGPPTVSHHRGRKCADEGGWCEFKGPATVYYGERDKFVVQQHPGRVQCANSVFGDPLVGVRKACWVDGEVPDSPPLVRVRRGTKCADENGWCNFRGTATVYYGAGNRWYVQQHTGRVRCANSVFGDPYVGTAKACFVEQRY